jgi:hypothetical protein
MSPTAIRQANLDLAYLARIAQVSNAARNQSQQCPVGYGTTGSNQSPRHVLEQVDATIADTLSRIQRIKADMDQPSAKPHPSTVHIDAHKPGDAPSNCDVPLPGCSGSLVHSTGPRLSTHRAALEKKLDMYRSDSKALAQLRAAVKEHEEVWSDLLWMLYALTGESGPESTEY